MTVTVGAYEAKTRFSELLATAAGGEAVVITKHGHPIAQLVALKESTSPVETTLSALAGIRSCTTGSGQSGGVDPCRPPGLISRSSSTRRRRSVSSSRTKWCPENLPALIATRPIVTPPAVPGGAGERPDDGGRPGRLSAAAADRAARLLQSLPIVTVTTDYTVLDLLRRSMSEDISAYDAAYLQLAMRLGATLATADSQLRARAVALGLGGDLRRRLTISDRR